MVSTLDAARQLKILLIAIAMEEPIVVTNSQLIDTQNFELVLEVFSDGIIVKARRCDDPA